MWRRKTPARKQSATLIIFKPQLRRYHIQSNTIRITFDPTYTDRIGIHAISNTFNILYKLENVFVYLIELIGSNTFDANFNFKTLSQSMAKLYDHAMKNIDTDIQFSFDDKLVSAHRNILCCRSTYFRSLLLHDFIEKSQTTPIKLTDIDYETFLELLYFVYTSKYHPTITLDGAIKIMMYANKIDFLGAKNAAMENICRHLRVNNESVLMIYSLAKKMSPAFDLLLDYIYDLCSERLNDICKQTDFMNLEKESMIDIICQATERRDAREQEKLKQTALLNEIVINNEEEE